MMSALLPKADIYSAVAHVRQVPIGSVRLGSSMSAKSQYRSSPMSERVLRQSIAPDLHLRRDGKRAELLHKREKIGHAPVLGDLAIAHAHHVHCLELDFATSWRHAEELALVRTVVGFVGRHPVPIGKLPV